MSKVSVVLPTYNRAHTLERAVRSVLNQTHKDFELIVVDDGSTDNTRDIVVSFADGRIRYIKHESNKGVAEARNTGIGASRASLIAFQDSDDEWLPHKLALQVEAMHKAGEHVGVVYSAFWREREGNTAIIIPGSEIQQTDGDLSSILLKHNFVTLQATLIKKECFDTLGLFDSKLRIFDDWDGILRIAQKYAFVFIAEPLVVAHATPGNLTSRKTTRLNDRAYFFEKHQSLYVQHSDIYKVFAYNIGNAFALRGDMPMARKYLRWSMRGTPWRIKYVVAFLLAVPGYASLYKYIAKKLGRTSAI